MGDGCGKCCEFVDITFLHLLTKVPEWFIVNIVRRKSGLVVGNW